MHACSSGSALLVNAEVDSMGGVVDGGGGVDTKPSPLCATIEKAQAELRQEYDVREERRRELEFLEKGGNPLDFKLGNAASVSVQSTSLTDQHPEQFVTSEAKGSFALTASPHGDSAESSGRPGAPSVCEPNSADNLMLFDGENEFHEGERNSEHPRRSNIAPSEQSQLDGSQNAKESGDSAAFGLPRKAYKRRNRSRPNRDGTRSSSTDLVASRGHTFSLPSRHAPRDAKGLILDVDNQKDWNISSNSNPKPRSLNDSIVLKAVPSDSRLDMELDGVRVVESATGLTKGGLPDANESPVDMACGELDSVGGREQVALSGLGCLPCVASAEVENQAISSQMNGFSSTKGDRKSIPNEGQNSSAVFSTKGLDSESSCTQTSLSLDGNNDNEICTNFKNIDSDGNTKEQTLGSEETPSIEGDKVVKENNETKTDKICAFAYDHNSAHRLNQENGLVLKAEEELKESGPGLQNEVKNPTTIEGMEPDSFTASETEIKPGNLLGSNSTPQEENACASTLPGSLDSSIRELSETTFSMRGSMVAPQRQICSRINFKLASKAHQDSILEEARIIEAKRKRIAELSVGTLPSKNQEKSHWDFVLEEMAWLANDFAQERLWKITAAAQICSRVAFTSRLRFQEQNSCWKQKEVAHTLAKAVMEFWRSAEDGSKELAYQCPGKDFALSVQGYAVRFLKCNSSHAQHGPAEVPVTPDKIYDLGILDMSWEDHLTEENLFYTVPAGAMEAYRKSIESHLLQCERTGGSMQEEVETSGYDAVADFGSKGNAFEEDEGETNTFYLPGAFEGSKSSKFAQKKQKNLTKTYDPRSYEVGADLPFMQCMENKVGTQQSLLIGKRPSNSLNVSFQAKRMRTASRQRVPSPFSAGTSGCVQAQNKTDASSGDTNSFQDDQSTLHGGSQILNNLEVESVGEFEKKVPFDSTEVPNKPKRKKKPKHLGSTYEHRWQLDSNFHNEQKDYSRKRFENHQLESNGSSGLFGQHIMKKPKMMKQSLDNSLDNLTPIAGSMPSPVASQMSNMSNPNKFIKLLSGRDRGRKAKALKMPAGQPGSGCPWSLFEDQALVVLVHDMGPNWELVSDAINSTLQFKSIFRKPKECKERHKVLMDRTAGDGADSAEDSGSSQPYPSTLPGIPKGSARQLFQRLQGPMEEDTLKSHFEKIIMLGQKQHYPRTQNDNLELKQPQQPHNSHTLSLSKVCPNNLNGGPVLTPIDLCDAITSSLDALSPGHQGPHTSGLPISNQGTVSPMLPASGANSSVQGSSNVVLGSNFSSQSVPLNVSIRDGRYGISRTASLTTDEQQRMQQYNQMLSGRNVQPSSLPVAGALPGTERGVRMLHGGNSMGIMCGLNRSVPMARPGFQGIASSSMLNSGSMLSSGMVTMPSPVGSPGQGNSMLRPRDASHMMRPSQNPEHQRQMMVPELQMQVSQGNSSQGASPFSGLSTSFSNQTAPTAVQSYPLQHHQQPHSMPPQPSHALSNSHRPHLRGPNHATHTQHQAFAIRYAKERQQQQQRLMMQQQHQHQQFAVANGLMTPAQLQSQLPISSPQSSQIQSQTSSPPVSLSPLTSSSSLTPMSQHPQKHNMLAHGIGRNPQTGGSGLPNQMGKQRQRQPQQQQFQQGGRNHPQQRQQSQQQAKLLKGVARGNMMHQNLPIDPSLLNGLSATPGSQSAEKGGEQVMHLMQGQGLYSGSGLNPVQPSKQLVPPHSSNQSYPQQKMYSSQVPLSSKQHLQMPSHSDNSNQNHVPSVTAGPTSSTSHQVIPPSVMASSNHQQLQPKPQPQLKLVNQTQPTVQKVLQQNRQVNSDPPSKVQTREAQPEHHPVNSSTQMSTTAAMPQACVDSSNVIPVDSSANAPQWKESEPLYGSTMPNHATQLGPSGTPPLTNSSGGEPPPPVSQGLGQRQSSGSLPSIGHDGGIHWQQQPSPLQPPTPAPPVQQQQQQELPQQKMPPKQQSQQQTASTRREK